MLRNSIQSTAATHGNISHLGMGSLIGLALFDFVPTLLNGSFVNLFTPRWRRQLLTETSASVSVRMGSDQLIMHNNAALIGLCRNLRAAGALCSHSLSRSRDGLTCPLAI